MKLSIFYDHVVDAAGQSGKSIVAILQEAADAGISAVEINHENIARQPDMLDNIRAAGMSISGAFLFYDFGGAEYGDETRMRAHVDTAKKLGMQCILAVPGFLDDANARELNALLDHYRDDYYNPAAMERLDSWMRSSDQIMKITEMLRRMVAYAKTQGITVMLEDFDGYRAPFARALPLLWFMQNVDGLRFALDTGNFAYSDEDVEAGFDLLSDYIVHVHCKDRGVEASCEGFRYKKGMAPVAAGDGYLPLCKLARILLDRGYNGYFAIEHYGHGNQEAAILRSAENLLKA